MLKNMQRTSIFNSIETRCEITKNGGYILTPSLFIHEVAKKNSVVDVKFDFELVFEDNKSKPTYKPYEDVVIIRQYMWQQIDSNSLIDRCYHTLHGNSEYNHGNEILKILNKDVDKLKIARNIINRDGKRITSSSLLPRSPYFKNAQLNTGCVVINGSECAFRDVFGPYYYDDKGYYSDDYR